MIALAGFEATRLRPLGPALSHLANPQAWRQLITFGKARNPEPVPASQLVSILIFQPRQARVPNSSGRSGGGTVQCK
jgi:hypothetical protein